MASGEATRPRVRAYNGNLLLFGAMVLVISVSTVGHMWLLSVRHASHESQSLNTKRPSAPSKTGSSQLDLKLVSQGRPAEFDLLPEPLFVTFGNDGFQDLLANFVCNLRSFPPMLKHTLIIVTSQECVDRIASFNTDVTIGIIADTILQRGYDYNTKDYIDLMLLRGHYLLKILGEKEIVWLEADAVYYKNLLDDTAITETRSDFVFFRDQFMFGGGFIRFARTQATREFYSEVISRLNESTYPQDFLSRSIRFFERLKLAFNSPSQAPWYEKLHRAFLSQANDQFILNTYLNEKIFNYTQFDSCLYRSGYYFHSWIYQIMCSGIEPVMQQHNWMIGVQTKIGFAKSSGTWFLDPDDPTKCRSL
jgi:hypothetical protein